MDLLTVLGVAVLLTRVGLALYVAGLVRAKNSAGAVLRAICDLCVTVLAFWAVGAAILFQEHNHVLWLRADLLFGWKLNVEAFSLSFVFFNFVMLLTASGVVAGVVAERFRFFPLCIASLVLGGFVFPVAGKWIWTGWLARHGFFDLGGASALQMSAG
ncbi:MAG TPA: hypothetical protein VFC78_03995, partial [Tepidisphaeraceae bacterium]|nr:hypothetical protein [Tepidisphaeraceae bacterium]